MNEYSFIEFIKVSFAGNAKKQIKIEVKQRIYRQNTNICGYKTSILI